MSQNYKITLVNVFWTENGIDTRFFKTVDEQRQYFDILTEGVQAPFVNFQMGDNITTRVTYKDNSARSVEELMRCNYCVVQKFNEDKTQEIERRYFFAYPRSQDSMGQIIVDLSLDDLQTNYFRYKDTIAPCTITKAHINRWVEVSPLSEIYGFDGSVNSKLFEREQFQDVAKRLTKRTKLNFKSNDSMAQVNTWFRDNVWGWVYVYCDIKKYKVFNIDGAEVEQEFRGQPFSPEGDSADDKETLNSTLATICYPIYKTEKRVFRVLQGGDPPTNVFIEWSEGGFNKFKENNGNTSYIKSIKFSIMPPFDYADIRGYNFNNGDLNIESMRTTNFYLTNTLFDTQTYYCIYHCANVYNAVRTNEYVVEPRFNFTKSEIINATKNPIYNPKLLNADYFELKITNERGNGFSYDLQKLNRKRFEIRYTEALTPDITRSYARIVGNDGVYISETSQNLTGLVDSADMSLMVSNDQLSQMLANNKNFYLQNVLNIGEKMVMSGIGGAIAGRGIGAVVGATGEGLMSSIQFGLTLDNMRNAPKDLKNSNGNAYFNTMYTEPGLYIEEYEILENEKQIINDEMFKNGYVVNLIGKVSDYDNIRHTFNYLSANVETISAPISNEEKERLKQKLQNVRFWNTDTIDYENAKNYERWLNNEQ